MTDPPRPARHLSRRAFVAGAVGLGASCTAQPDRLFPPTTLPNPSERGGGTAATSTAAGAIPGPTGAVLTRWGRDPWALGASSYLATGATVADRRATAAPGGPRLYFAGEHTSADHPGTVHGALESGRRAASEVAELGRPGDSVLVIGAGAAGLQAAQDLTDAGFTVTVLEARSGLAVGRGRTVRSAWVSTWARAASTIRAGTCSSTSPDKA